MKVTGISDTPEPRSASSRAGRRRPTKSAAAPPTPCAGSPTQAFRGAGQRRRPGRPDEVLRPGPERRRLRGRHPHGRAGHPGQPAVPVPRRAARRPTSPAGSAYRVGDIELASRLSFFLWGTVPDAELREGGHAGTLKTHGRRSTSRCGGCSPTRSAEALATRFGVAVAAPAGRRRRCGPTASSIPHWDQSLHRVDAQGDRALLRAAWCARTAASSTCSPPTTSFVNERLARHYGIPERHRHRVPPGDAAARRAAACSTQGSILLLTSVADRTSPVQRGKWVMQVLLGSPPPPPPPNVPALEETERRRRTASVLSVRERMEQHRKNPACTSCHRVIDPLGLALENFDVTGQYRIKDNGVPVDADRRALRRHARWRAPTGLRAGAAASTRTRCCASFTESLMTYALGRHVESYDMPTVRTIVATPRSRTTRCRRSSRAW